MTQSFWKRPIVLFLLGWIIGDLTPTITDFIHFWLQNYIRTTSLSNTMFVFLQIIDWYFIDVIFPLFLLLLVAIFHIRKMSTIKQWIIIGSIIGTGAVITIILKILVGW
ncbi:MAG: hypothetical protein QXO70_03945 [Candidatus Pacearchaeota archaeon]